MRVFWFLANQFFKLQFIIRIHHSVMGKFFLLGNQNRCVQKSVGKRVLVCTAAMIKLMRAVIKEHLVLGTSEMRHPCMKQSECFGLKRLGESYFFHSRVVPPIMHNFVQKVQIFTSEHADIQFRTGVKSNPSFFLTFVNVIILQMSSVQ